MSILLIFVLGAVIGIGQHNGQKVDEVKKEEAKIERQTASIEEEKKE